MSKDEIFNKVKSILTDKSESVEADKVSIDSKLKEDLALDSIDTFDIIYEIENEFQIKVNDEDASTFTTISDVVNYIDTKLNESTLNS